MPAVVTHDDPQTTTLLNLSSIIDDIFMVLTDKEKEIVSRRFNLHNKGRETLESIGKDFRVTRERVRQIEESALKKLRRTLDNTQLQAIVDLAKQILEESGGLKNEEHLVNHISKFTTGSEIDSYIIRLALHIDEDIHPIKLKKSNELHDAWRLDLVSEKNIRYALDALYNTLKKETDVLNEKELMLKVKKQLNFESTSAFLKSVLHISRLFKETEKGFGLHEWRHINPKSIRDKAFIILKKNGKPMHFVEIANNIINQGFDKKSLTTQAVHNELIRNPIFVLVGRGLYGLREWGFEDGTVNDVIEDILKNSKKPMHKKEIIEEVLKRRDVKLGTISLNIQKNPKFVRVGRAVYEYQDKTKK